MTKAGEPMQSKLMPFLWHGMLTENLTIRRKYKATQEGIIKKWWFVINELLEEELSKIATQTGWKLEPALRYDNNNTIPAQQLSS